MTQHAAPIADLHAEAYVLGALLCDPRHAAALPARLQPESFYSEAHRQIFAAMLELREDRIDLNLTTVSGRLREKDRLRQVQGGSFGLVELAENVPVLTPSTFEHMAATVLNRATQRATQLVLARAAATFADPGLDVGEALADLERAVLGVSLDIHESGGLQPVKQALRDEVIEWGARSLGKGSPGIPTGFRGLDEEIGGLHGGDLLVLAARPGMGKTSLVTSLAVNVSKRGHATAIFSLEMPARQLAGRMLCTEAGLSVALTRAGRLSPSQLTSVNVALSDLKDLGIYIDDAARGRPYVSDIVSRSRRLAANLARKNQKLGLIVVDYIQIVKLRGELQKQRHDLAIAEVSIELKGLAKELGTTVIACAQLNRSVESRTDKRPGMADIRDSGQIEQDADLIAMLYRDEYYNPESKDKGIVEVLIEKNRHGACCTKRLRFDGPTTAFSDEPQLYDTEAAE